MSLQSNYASYYWNPTQRDHTTNLSEPISITLPPDSCSLTSIHVQNSYAIARSGKKELWVWGSPEKRNPSSYAENERNTYVDPNFLFNKIPKKLSLGNLEGRVVQIACSKSSCLILTDNGNVYNWGYNYLNAATEYSTLGLPPPSNNSLWDEKPNLIKSFAAKSLFIVDISINNDYATAIDVLGKAYIWGSCPLVNHKDFAYIDKDQTIHEYKDEKNKFKKCVGSSNALFFLTYEGQFLYYGYFGEKSKSFQIKNHPILQSTTFTNIQSTDFSNSLVLLLTKTGTLNLVYNQSSMVSFNKPHYFSFQSYQVYPHAVRAIAKGCLPSSQYNCLSIDRRTKRLYLYEWNFKIQSNHIQVKTQDSYIYELNSDYSEPFNLCPCSHPAITPFLYSTYFSISHLSDLTSGAPDSNSGFGDTQRIYEPKIMTSRRTDSRRSLSNSARGLQQDQVSTARGHITQRDPESRVPRYFGHQIHDITPTVDYLECSSLRDPKINPNIPERDNNIEETKATENITGQKSFSRILPAANFEMDNSDACSLLSSENAIFEKESPSSQQGDNSYKSMISHSRIQSELPPASNNNSLLNISKSTKRSFALPLQAIHNISYIKENPDKNKSTIDQPISKMSARRSTEHMLDLRQKKSKASIANESMLKENVPVSTSARVSESMNQSFRGPLSSTMLTSNNNNAPNPRTMEKKLWVEYFKKSFQKHYNQALSFQNSKTGDDSQIKQNYDTPQENQQDQDESLDHIKNMALRLKSINNVFLNLLKLSKRIKEYGFKKIQKESIINTYMESPSQQLIWTCFTHILQKKIDLNLTKAFGQILTYYERKTALQKYNQIQGLLQLSGVEKNIHLKRSGFDEIKKGHSQNKIQINYFHNLLNKFNLRQKVQSFKSIQLYVSNSHQPRELSKSKDNYPLKYSQSTKPKSSGINYYQIKTFVDKITQVYTKPAWQNLWKFYRHSTQKKLAFDKICRILKIRIFEQTRSAFRFIKLYAPPVKTLPIQRHKSVDRCYNRPLSHRPNYSHRLGMNESTAVTGIWNQRNSYYNQIKLENLVNIIGRMKRRKIFLTFLVLKKLPSIKKNPTKSHRNKLILKENQLRILKKLGRKIESKRREILIEALYELIKYSYHKFMNHYGNMDKYRKSINTARY